MPTTKQLMSALRRPFPSLIALDRSTIVKDQPLYYAEGVAVGRTSYKDKFYVWSFIMPVWSRVGRVHVDYSVRIGGGRFFEGSAATLALEIHQEVSACDTFRNRAFGAESPPRQFLTIFDHYDWDKIGIPTPFLDFGLTLALSDQCERSLPFLQRYLERAPQDPEDLRALVVHVMSSIKNGHDGYISEIQDLGRARFENLKNASSR